MKTGLSLVELATRIEQQQAAKQDFIVPTRDLEYRLTSKGDVQLTMPTAPIVPKTLPIVTTDRMGYDLRPTAHDQIGTHLQIPAKYYDRMLRDEPELLVKNVNTWMKRSDVKERRMVRTLDNDARAFLSNAYQRIENEEIAAVALPILLSTPGLKVVSAEVTEKKLYIQATTDRLQGEVKRGDVVQAGVIISNSEIGYGSVSVRTMVYRLLCLNGMVGAEGYRANHVGRRIEDNEALWKDDTRKADDKAILLKVRDMVSASMSEQMFTKQLNKMKELTGQKIEGDPAKSIEVLSRKIGASEQEKGGILRALIEGGDLSRWGILNAVTAQAHTADYDRGVEFESMGGQLLDLPASEWKEVLTAGVE